jgi:hypothetical protein
MPTDQEIKIVPPKASPLARNPRSSYVPWLIVLIGVYFALVMLTAWLPLSGYMQTLSLVLGTLLILDVLHSAKWMIKNFYDKG